jgi:hypothetical protein
MRRDFTNQSSETYHIDPKHLRALHVELMQRTRENAYGSHKECKQIPPEERAKRYDDLKEKIRAEGFKEEFPITIMLLRNGGKKDRILQGHHRLISIAIELDLRTVPVRFVYRTE